MNGYQDGYGLEDGEVDTLYCQQGSWVGKRPSCTKLHDKQHEDLCKVKEEVNIVPVSGQWQGEENKSSTLFIVIIFKIKFK